MRKEIIKRIKEYLKTNKNGDFLIMANSNTITNIVKDFIESYRINPLVGDTLRFDFDGFTIKLRVKESIQDKEFKLMHSDFFTRKPLPLQHDRFLKKSYKYGDKDSSKQFLESEIFFCLDNDIKLQFFPTNNFNAGGVIIMEPYKYAIKKYGYSSSKTYDILREIIYQRIDKIIEEIKIEEEWKEY